MYRILFFPLTLSLYILPVRPLVSLDVLKAALFVPYRVEFLTGSEVDPILWTVVGPSHGAFPARRS